MESLITDFVKFSSAVAKFLFLEGRLRTRPGLYLTLIFS